MQGQGRIRRFFAGANSSKGFYSLYSHITNPMASRIIVIKGGPGVGKSTFMKSIGQSMSTRGYETELFHCSSDPESLDGVAMPEIGVALIDGTAPHIVDPVYPGAVDEIIHLGDYWNEDALRSNRQEIIRLTKENSRLFARAYRFLRAAQDILDDLRDVHIQAMDFGRANIIYEEIRWEILGDSRLSSKPGAKRRLFASAITPIGYINHIETIVADCPRRYVVDGEPGTGRSTLISRIAEDASLCGLEVEILHCPLNPDRVEHLVIPELETAMITSARHHRWKLSTGDMVIDMARFLDAVAVSEAAGIVAYDWDMVENMLSRAVYYLNRAYVTHNELESMYVSNIDFDGITELRERTLDRILAHAAALLP